MRASSAAIMSADVFVASGFGALAGTLEDDHAAVNATLTGQWSGVAVNEVIATGELVETPVSINYVLFSEDGLNYASGGERGISLAYYRGDGRYRIEQWPFEGEPQVIEYQVLRISPPDANGNWMVEEMIMWPQADGTFIPWPQTWSMTDGVLAVTREAPPEGLFPPSETTWRGYIVLRE